MLQLWEFAQEEAKYAFDEAHRLEERIQNLEVENQNIKDQLKVEINKNKSLQYVLENAQKTSNNIKEDEQGGDDEVDECRWLSLAVARVNWSYAIYHNDDPGQDAGKNAIYERRPVGFDRVLVEFFHEQAE